MALPAALEKELERFKKEYGPGWSQKAVRLLEEEIKRKKAKKKLAEFMKATSGRIKLSEKEIFQRLENRS
ncbi:MULTISPECIES: hypothetical protein [Meiothermus]|jgi:hypothetical protein|uniref:CopG family transcriptional regulator n=3 Tax=Meiothermus TaxID=65551 RepID=A0A399E569_9DEIN|nr:MULTISPECIES: hypothetical protein [Meiothermus]GIW39004.1 MAG: hypothetical protein KatS3mg075_485 [Meiothermus sp.]ADD28184.1 hypothetical protein Mrub_1422 [Meiothermus ruber DSM 1279]AWR86791.1 hypothetical protein Mtai_v1c15500 [Meiothermus taiwanensis WR-220]MCL6528895.1 hypothetical protein [Meiothermus ruber]RIH79036.1 hypothetical protein Mcate_00549 [Meiothermus taiwanensis]